MSEYYSQSREDIESLIPLSVSRVLDIGCGEGILGKRLLERGAKEVTGVEINSSACEKAARNISRVICGNIEELDLPFEDGYFDCIILGDVLEHLKDPAAVLVKLGRTLSDTGEVIASIPNIRYYGILNMLVEGYWSYADYGILDRTHLRFFTRKEMEGLFQKAGYELSGISSVNIDPSYNSVSDPGLSEVSFGRVTLKGLSPEEIRDLFVIQYLIRAKKTGYDMKHADVAISEGRDTDAERILEEHMLLHPADTNALFKYAGVCYRRGNLERALDALEKVLLFDRERSDAIELKRIIEEVYYSREARSDIR